jgi:hypothetical protein
VSFWQNTKACAPLTREAFLEGMAELERLDQKHLAEMAERGREISERVAREGMGGPLQQALDRHYLRCGPLVVSPLFKVQLEAALEAERRRDG